jgi:hypothetical protein
MIIMKNINRTTKTGEVIKATVKSYFITVKEDIQTGKLKLQGENSKYITDINYNKTVKAGEKICLRIAFKQANGKTLVYLHRNGWALVDDLNEAFASSKGIKEDLYDSSYEDLSMAEKIRLFKTYSPEKFENLTKTETMLMAFLENKDLAEIEKEIHVDKSLKYKIKKHADNFAETFAKKLEDTLLA